MLSPEAFDLVKSTYNMKHKYITRVNDTKCVNLLMTLETQTVGFIAECFKGVKSVVRQKRFASYYVDLFIEEDGIVVECDEHGHKHRDQDYEDSRERYLTKECGLRLIRFDPNHESFELCHVMNAIMRMMFDATKSDRIVRFPASVRPGPP